MIYKTDADARKVALARYYRLRDIELGELAADEISKGTVAEALRGFWARVQVGKPNECWPWKGGRSKKGYGRLEVGGDHCAAHRVAWEITRRWVLQAGDVVMHKICDNPPCCNPAHLRKGTTIENNKDMFDRGRAPSQKGEGNHNAKLTKVQVLEMKELAATGSTKVELAERFGVSPSHIHNIVVGRFWAKD